MLWLVGSLLFSWYVNNFGNYNETYGSVAAVIILMLWFNLTSFIILLGAETNSELEHQTAKDSTVGEDRPLTMPTTWLVKQTTDKTEIQLLVLKTKVSVQNTGFLLPLPY